MANKSLKMSKEQLNRALKSVGKESFVSNYPDYKNCNDSKQRRALAEKLLDENEKATGYDAQCSRISNAKRIFRDNLQKDAMDIIRKSDRVDDVTRKLADEYYTGKRAL